MVSSGFEGGGFDNVAGNFDGMGVSAGALQQNYGSGTLQALLRAYIATYGAIKGFPVDITPSSSMDTADAIQFSFQMQQDQHLTPEWTAAWKAFLGTPECIAVQLTLASDIDRYAAGMCATWGIQSLQAYCFFFDVKVQNGGMRGLSPTPGNVTDYQAIMAAASAQNSPLWLSISPSDDEINLVKSAWARSRLARPAYQADVFNRKATIIMQQGWDHDKFFDFRQLQVSP